MKLIDENGSYSFFRESLMERSTAAIEEQISDIDIQFGFG